MESVEEEKQYLIYLIGELKTGLMYSKYANGRTYDKVCDILDEVANIIDDELKEKEREEK